MLTDERLTIFTFPIEVKYFTPLAVVTKEPSSAANVHNFLCHNLKGGYFKCFTLIGLRQDVQSGLLNFFGLQINGKIFSERTFIMQGRSLIWQDRQAVATHGTGGEYF
jgi:hypothetical protein